MTKYVLVKLSFQNAKFFTDKTCVHIPYGFGVSSKYLDKPIDAKSRTICPENTIPKHCMTNLVSVLMGDRPIPTKRACSPIAIYDQSKYADIASRCFVEILTDKSNKTIMTTNKAMYSHAPEHTSVQIELDGKMFKLGRNCPTHQTMSLAWQSVRFPNEYAEFDAVCVKVLGSDYKTKYNFPETLTELRKRYVANQKAVVDFVASKEAKSSRSTGFYRDCVSIIKTGTIIGTSTFRVDGTYDVGTYKSIYAPILACPPNHGNPELANVASGNIYMKLTEAEWVQMLNGPMCATLFDGGYVSVPTVCEAWNDTYESLPTPYEPSKD